MKIEKTDEKYDDIMLSIVASIFLSDKEKLKYARYTSQTPKVNFLKESVVGRFDRFNEEKLIPLKGFMSRVQAPFETVSEIFKDTLTPLISFLPLEARITVSVAISVIAFLPLLVVGGMGLYWLEGNIKKNVFYTEKVFNRFPQLTRDTFDTQKWFTEIRRIRRGVFLRWSRTEQKAWDVIKEEFVRWKDLLEEFPEAETDLDDPDRDLANKPVYTIRRKVVKVRQPRFYQPLHELIFSFKSISQLFNNQTFKGILDFGRDMAKVPLDSLLLLFGGDVSNNRILSKLFQSQGNPDAEEIQIDHLAELKQ